MSRPRAAVVGGGIGGLTAAGLLARAGCAVTLFEAGARLGGKAGRLRAEGLTLDTGPTLLAMPAVVRDVFARLGAPASLPPLVALDPQCHYAWDDGTHFTAHADLEPTAASAAAIDPREAAALRRFYAESAALYRAAGEPYLERAFAGPADFLRRVARRGPGAIVRGLRMGTLAELAARHFRTPYLRQFVGRFATYAGASPYRASAAYALVPHLERTEGVHHVTGGMSALADALAAAVGRLGVRVVLGARAGWTRRQGRRFVVGPSGGEDVFDAVVVNADPLGALGRGHEPMALSGHVLCLGVPERLTLPHHTVLFARDYRQEFAQLFAGEAPADPTVYVCHPAATDRTMAAPGTSGLHVMVNAPPLAGRAAEPALAERLRDAALARLERAWPGLGARATLLGERTPADFAHGGAPRGSLYGFLPHGRFGPFRRPRIRGPVPGLFYAGGGTHPGGGVPLVMLSGRFAAELALEHLGVRA